MNYLLSRWLLCICGVTLLSGQVQTEGLSQSIQLPPACQVDCQSEFGLTLGVSPSGVPAYSNCNANCVLPEPHFVDEVFTGIQWQCVEYARRWLLHNLGVVYGDVDIAADIWQLDSVLDPESQLQYPFQSIENGAQEKDLQFGDLLIYASSYLDTGHVAVVTSVNWQQQFVEVAEQNYQNREWSQPYARRIDFILKDHRLWLLDRHLIGWKRVSGLANRQ